MSKTYITSKDYEVYWTLKQSGFPILGRMVGRGERQFSSYGGSAPKECKEEIIEDCQLGAFEFIDPASQQKTTKEAAAEEMYELLQKMYYFDELITCRIPDVGEVLEKARGEE